MHLGAIFAGAQEELQRAFYNLGCILGELVQIQDDLADAFAVPASPDWLAGRHNLPILYASLVEHPQKERFLELAHNIAEPSNLAQAQQILIASGALSYCIYQLISRYERAKILLDEMTLANREPLQHIFDQRLLPVVNLLRQSGLPVPAELGQLWP
jgi:geranylgeranyl pyrophosphate synthase